MTYTPSKDWIAMTLAIGLCTAMNMFTFAVLYDAIFSENSGLSENATQVLTGWGGGIIGILGAVFGYRAGASHQQQTPTQVNIETDLETTERD